MNIETYGSFALVKTSGIVTSDTVLKMLFKLNQKTDSENYKIIILNIAIISNFTKK